MERASFCFSSDEHLGIEHLEIEINVRDFQTYPTPLNTFLWFMIIIAFFSLPCQNIKLHCQKLQKLLLCK